MSKPDVHYKEFIRETYIDTVRSVLIVDDDYPTLGDVLRSAANATEDLEFTDKAYLNDHSAKAAIKATLDEFRKKQWLVDVDDWTHGADEHDPGRLHQCDLLVLDFQLNRTVNDGSEAIRILRQLLSNSHFNLAVVNSSNAVDSNFYPILFGLLSPCLVSRKDDVALAETFFDKIGDIKSALYRRLEENPMLYLEAREKRGAPHDKLSQAFDEASTEYSSVAQHVKAAVGQYLLVEYEQKNVKDWGSSTKVPLTWGTPVDTNVQGAGSGSYFIASETLFVAFRQKVTSGGRSNPASYAAALRSLNEKVSPPPSERVEVDSRDASVASATSTSESLLGDAGTSLSIDGEASDIINSLLTALYNWRPNPSQLVQAKLRSEIYNAGVAVGGGLVPNRWAAAFWYRELLMAEETERRSLVRDTVTRHAEHLVGVVLPTLEDFVHKLAKDDLKAKADKEQAAQAACTTRFNINLTESSSLKTATLHHNAFVSTIFPQGWHLTTGHIFQIVDVGMSEITEDGTRSSRLFETIWVCVSPACDTVPRKRKDDPYAGGLRFHAVKLEEDDKAISKANHNRFLFIEQGGTVKQYCFGSDDRAAPPWRIFVAEDEGRINDLEFRASATYMHSGLLCVQHFRAKVIAQLRYEYALNLVNRLGTTLTRIGLDFRNV